MGSSGQLTPLQLQPLHHILQRALMLALILNLQHLKQICQLDILVSLIRRQSSRMLIEDALEALNRIVEILLRTGILVRGNKTLQVRSAALGDHLLQEVELVIRQADRFGTVGVGAGELAGFDTPVVRSVFPAADDGGEARFEGVDAAGPGEVEVVVLDD